MSGFDRTASDAASRGELTIAYRRLRRAKESAFPFLSLFLSAERLGNASKITLAM